MMVTATLLSISDVSGPTGSILTSMPSVFVNVHFNKDV